MDLNTTDTLLIKPHLLKIDPSYQRGIQQKRIEKIVQNFNPMIFNEPKVSKRSDGFYYVFDGQHSVIAHKAKYGDDVPIKCKVFYGLTPEDEMQLFIQQNGISKSVTKLEKLRAKANYSDPEVVDMIDCARVAGVSIDFNMGPGTDRIIAVDTAYSIYKAIGRNSFINMLSVIHKSWLGEAESYAQGILKGFGFIFRHCADQLTGISIKEMVQSFSGYPISKITERANMLMGSMEKRYATALVEQYNKRKKSKRILLP